MTDVKYIPHEDWAYQYLRKAVDKKIAGRCTFIVPLPIIFCQFVHSGYGITPPATKTESNLTRASSGWEKPSFRLGETCAADLSAVAAESRAAIEPLRYSTTRITCEGRGFGSGRTSSDASVVRRPLHGPMPRCCVVVNTWRPAARMARTP